MWRPIIAKRTQTVKKVLYAISMVPSYMQTYMTDSGAKRRTVTERFKRRMEAIEEVLQIASP